MDGSVTSHITGKPSFLFVSTDLQLKVTCKNKQIASNHIRIKGEITAISKLIHSILCIQFHS